MAKKIKGKGPDGKETEIEVEDGGNEPLTEEALDAKFNAMITARLSRFEASLTKSMEGLLAKAVPATAPEGEAKKGKKAEGGEELDARLKDLQARLDSERKAREDADKAREEAEERRRSGERSRALAATLSDLGVSPGLREAAQALLETKGRVVLAEDGSVGFKAVDKYGNERVAPLKDGLADWFKSEGSAFVPAKGAGGSGGTVPRQAPAGPKGPRQLSPAEAKEAAQKAAAIDLARALSGLPPEAAE